MEYIYYRVAHHLFAIAVPDRGAAIVFLPSYEPFRISDGTPEEAVFTLFLEQEPVIHKLPEFMAFRWEEAHCRIYKKEETYAFGIEPDEDRKRYVMACSRDFKEAHLQFTPHEKSFGYAFNNYLMLLFALSTLQQKTLILHASVVMYKRKAYAFLGKSGTGKSTHSRLWLQYIQGSTLLNDDNPILRIIDGKALLFGSPWSGKTPCYRNEEAPVGAFVQLHQATRNCISRCNAIQALASLLPATSTMKWDKHACHHTYQTLSDAISQVPVFSLNCRPDKDAALLCHQQITRH